MTMQGEDKPWVKKREKVHVEKFNAEVNFDCSTLACFHRTQEKDAPRY